MPYYLVMRCFWLPCNNCATEHSANSYAVCHTCCSLLLANPWQDLAAIFEMHVLDVHKPRIGICSCHMRILRCTEIAYNTLVLIELVSLFNIWNSTFKTAIMLDNCVNYLYVLINHDYLWSLLVCCFLHCSAWRWTCSAPSFPTVPKRIL